MHVIDYQVVIADSASQLEERVRILMGKGFSLQGGVSIAVATSETSNGQQSEWGYAQAMIRTRC